jgi:tRNA threonylcarbamoyladenosine biosynthesis protein TsaE
MKGINDMKIDSYSAADTYQIGYRMGMNAKKGEVYCLSGDLGVGKTVFTQGFAKGLRVEEAVSSPTFTIIQEYTDGRLPFYHFDVYRIGDIEEMEEIGCEDYFYGNGVCLIEWAELIEELLPKDRTRISIKKDLKQGFDYREITVEDGREESLSF